jgi:hypothetical protein
MTNNKHCPQCWGKKNILGDGMMTQTCPTCNGKGIVEDIIECAEAREFIDPLSPVVIAPVPSVDDKHAVPAMVVDGSVIKPVKRKGRPPRIATKHE